MDRKSQKGLLLAIAMLSILCVNNIYAQNNGMEKIYHKGWMDFSNNGVKDIYVVQLYVKNNLSSVVIYESQLRGFERVSLVPGESKILKFKLRPDDLSLFDRVNKLGC